MEKVVALGRRIVGSNGLVMKVFESLQVVDQFTLQLLDQRTYHRMAELNAEPMNKPKLPESSLILHGK